MWNVIAWVIIGGVAGWLASLIARTDARRNWLVTIAAGLAGAVIGGWLYSALTGVEVSARFEPMTLLVATLGALALLAISLAITQRGFRGRAI